MRAFSVGGTSRKKLYKVSANTYCQILSNQVCQIFDRSTRLIKLTQDMLKKVFDDN